MVVIFDLDGVLVDSEPLWREAEIDVFSDLGVRLGMDLLAESRGLRIDESVAFLVGRSPGLEVDREEVAGDIVDRMIGLIEDRGEALPGVVDALSSLAVLGARLAVASSSPSRLIRAAIRSIGLDGRFEAICSAEDEPLGKPHPGVYLSAATALGVDPARCLAVEDSLPGVLAAKAARMSCLAVLEPGLRDDPRFAIADHRIDSLVELSLDGWRWMLETFCALPRRR